MKDLTTAYRPRPRVGLIGFYGWGNYGDELFRQRWQARLAPWFEAAPVNDLLRPPYVSRGPERVATEYEAFIIGGGDLVLPQQVSGLYWHPAWLQRSVYITGVGVPFHDAAGDPNAIAEMGEFFRHPNVRYISARDEESAAWIRQRLRPSIPVDVHPDLAFASPLPTPLHYAEPKVLGLVLRRATRHGPPNDYSRLQQLVRTARERGYTPKVIVLAIGRRAAEDRSDLNALSIGEHERIESDSVDELTAALGGLDVLVSMKLHGAIMAARYGVPTIALESNTKNRVLYRSWGRPDLLSHLTGDPDLVRRLDAAERGMGRVSGTVNRWSEHAEAAIADVQLRLVRAHAPHGSPMTTVARWADRAWWVRNRLPDGLRRGRH